MIIGLLLLACTGGQPAADPPPPTSEPPAAAPSQAPSASGTTPRATGSPQALAQAGTHEAEPGTVWTAATLPRLQPQAPTHQATVPLPLPTTAELQGALATLGSVVDAEATQPDNPWAIGHGLVARGEGLRLTNGENAVDWLFSRYAERFEVDGNSFLRFPASAGTVRLEPHSDLMLKTLTEVVQDPSRRVTVDGHQHPISDLWRGSLVRSYLVPQTNHSRYASPDDMAWSIQGLAAWAPRGLRWRAQEGTPMDMDELAAFGVAVLFSETRFLARALKSRQPFQREGQGIFKYTCGGAHLLQSAGLAAVRGFGGLQSQRVLQEQPVLMLYRFPIEVAQYREAMSAMPQHGDKLTVQRLKFAGHYLESMSKLAAWGFWSPQERDLPVLQAAADEVAWAAQELQRRGLLDDLAGIRARDEQLYLDIVGDSAHAIDGLELALGRRPVRW